MQKISINLFFLLLIITVLVIFFVLFIKQNKDLRSEIFSSESDSKVKDNQYFDGLVNRVISISKEHDNEVSKGNYINFEQFFTNKKVNGIPIEQKEIGVLKVKGRKIIVSDPLTVGNYLIHPLIREVNPGNYPVILSIASFKPETYGERVAFAKLKFSDNPVNTWEKAKIENFEPGFFGVDRGLASVMDIDAAKLIANEIEQYESKDPKKYNFYTNILSQSFTGHDDWGIYYPENQKEMNVVMFHSGMGDGIYSSFWGLDKSGEPSCLIVDFSLFTENESIEIDNF